MLCFVVQNVGQLHVKKMSVVEMIMLRWTSDNILKDRINECIHRKLEVALIDNKMRENRLRWFGHVQSRSIWGPIKKRIILIGNEN